MILKRKINLIRNNMKIFTGKVKSVKMQKTAVVVVNRVIKHPIYKKRIRRAKSYLVHDEFGVKVGQNVKFVASRPYSKLKKWKIIEIIGLGKNKKKAVGKKGAKK